VTNPEPSNVGDDLGLGLRLPGRGTVDATGRRRTHPISPIVFGASTIPVGVIFVLAMWGGAIATYGLTGFLIAAGVVLVLAIAVAGWMYLVWRNTWYWFDSDGDFRVDSGVLTKRQRRLQLSRLQTVDVAQPLFARIFSMAELSVEVAGGRDSRVKLRYLQLDDARALRNEVLARAAGLRHDTAEAPESPITSVTPRDLALSLLMRSVTAGLLLLTIFIIVVTVLSSGWGGLGIALVTGGLPIIIVISEFMKYFNFTVSESPDGLRLRFGLAKTETRTVPPGRVQAIEYVEPLLWRRQGWVRLRLNIAGVGREDSNGNREETLLIPVATREVADDLVQRVLPGLDVGRLDWQPAPERSRWRSPIQWRRLAVGWDRSVFAARSGRITRRLAVIPHARTQSVRYTQGPWERSLDLASVHVDSTPGPVRISGRHLDAPTARRVVDEQVARASAGRAEDRTVHWATEQDVPAAGQEPSADDEGPGSAGATS
jgi:putative membrane protein